MREGIKTILANSPERKYSIVGEVSTIQELRLKISETSPDVVILDISLADGNSLEFLREVTLLKIEIQFLILSMYHKSHFVLRAMQNGARGFISKESAGTELLSALETLEKGLPYLDPLSLENVLAGIRTLPLNLTEVPPNLAILSPREREIFWLLIRGENTKIIAHTLDLSGKTVDNHRLAIYEKLQVKGMADLMIFARDLGLF